jgi:hypothetical protein
MIEPTTLIGGGALIAILYGGWEYVKMYLSKIYGLFVVRINVDDEVLRNAIVVWSFKNLKRMNISIRNFVGWTDFIKPLGKNQLVAFESPSKEPTICLYGKIPIIISTNSLTFFRWTLNVEKIMKEIVDEYNNSMGDSCKENRFYIRKYHGTLQDTRNNYGSEKYAQSSTRGDTAPPIPGDNSAYQTIKNSLPVIGWKRDDIGQLKKPEPLAHLALSKECEQALEEIRRWRKSEEWYKERQIPHKKGILLYGKPGCGKSSIAKAIAMDLNMPIMIFDLSNMSNNDFQDKWDNVKNNAPCMVLLEDIDSIFDGRKNIVHEEGGLSFDCLLNCIDGVESADGILIVATTNNIEKIDIALGKPNGDGISTRPGRIDRALELTAPDAAGRMKIAKRILGDNSEYLEIVVAQGSHDTGAQFQERCSRLALKLFWENKEVS